MRNISKCPATALGSRQAERAFAGVYFPAAAEEEVLTLPGCHYSALSSARTRDGSVQVRGSQLTVSQALG